MRKLKTRPTFDIPHSAFVIPPYPPDAISIPGSRLLVQSRLRRAEQYNVRMWGAAFLMMTVELEYGATDRFAWEVSAGCQALLLGGPREQVDLAAATHAALAQPIELPPLNLAVVPGDRVVLAVERDAALLPRAVAAIWDVLQARGVDPADVLVLQPADVGQSPRCDPRRALPAEVRDLVSWQRHDPTADDSCGYLASSASGERLYLSRELLAADLVIPVTVAGFDALQGYKSPCHVLYPGLSNVEAFQKTHGLGHRELQPQHVRPLRQLVDEVGWLLGVQYTVQVVPSARRGQAAEVLVGSIDGVSRRAQQLLDRDWRVRLPERVDTVIVAIPGDDEPVTWARLGAALEVARNLVERGGQVIVLSDLEAQPGPGVQVIREYRSARAALQPLRALGCEDLIPATQLATAADWARVYLLSRLEASLVEELFCMPLENQSELTRLLEQVQSCLVLTAAPFVHGEISPPTT